jgi:hypothetical protein
MLNERIKTAIAVTCRLHADSTANRLTFRIVALPDDQIAVRRGRYCEARYPGSVSMLKETENAAREVDRIARRFPGLCEDESKLARSLVVSAQMDRMS